MGKMLLLLVGAVAVVAFPLWMLSSRSATDSTDVRLGVRAHRTLARTIAISGLSEAESRLAPALAQAGTYAGASTLAGAYAGGNYTVTIGASGDTYTLRSEGQFEDETAHASRVYRLERPGGPEPRVPGFMGAAITVGNNTTIRYEFNLTSESPANNANLHTNNDLQFQGGTSRITGFVTAGNNIRFSNGQTPEQILQPNVNPDNAPLYRSRVPKLTLPSFSAVAYLGIADRVSPGDQYLSGSYTLGTRENPVVWYIGGNLRTSGNVSISGYGAMIVRGNVNINHNVTAGAGTSGTSTFAVYTGNDVTVDTGSLTLSGQFYVGNNLFVRSNTTLVGNVTIKNNITTEGRFNTIYRPASGVLTQPFWPQGEDSDSSGSGSEGEPLRLVLVSAREW